MKGTEFKIGTRTYWIERAEHDADKTERHRERIPFTVRGVRGGEWVLMRTQPAPECLFAWNVKRFSRSTPFEGFDIREIRPGVVRFFYNDYANATVEVCDA